MHGFSMASFVTMNLTGDIFKLLISASSASSLVSSLSGIEANFFNGVHDAVRSGCCIRHSLCYSILFLQLFIFFVDFLLFALTPTTTTTTKLKIKKSKKHSHIAKKRNKLLATFS
ncbi:hypothetical protein Dimus_000754 [Dionaea muscipula]